MYKKIALSLMVFCNMSLFAEHIPLSQESLLLKKGIYQHYKGNLYEVLGVAHHSETLEEVVVYRLLYGDYGHWVRPASMFYENVEYPNHEIGPRFRFIGEPGNFEPTEIAK